MEREDIVMHDYVKQLIINADAAFSSLQVRDFEVNDKWDTDVYSI